MALENDPPLLVINFSILPGGLAVRLSNSLSLTLLPVLMCAADSDSAIAQNGRHNRPWHRWLVGIG